MVLSVPDAARQLNKATVSSAYALFMLMLAEERGIDGGRILAGSGVERDRLAQPDARITPLQQAAIVFNLLDATDDPSIAIEIGLRSSLTKAGLIGFGLMSCAQLDGIVDIDVLEAFPLGRLRQFAVENFLVETAILFNSLLYPVPGRTLQSRAELHFEWPEPPWFERYRARLPRCHFDASANRIRCDAALLGEPIGTANAHTAQMIVQQCEAELARLGYAESIVERVRNLLICGEGGYPSVDDVARELHVSPRTLKRKLAEYGATYSALLDEIRLRDALRLLEGTRLPVDEIAARVGYTDRANFTRAFKRWTGVAPSERR